MKGGNVVARTVHFEPAANLHEGANRTLTKQLESVVSTSIARMPPLWARTTFMMCDIQERFRSLIFHFDDVVHTAQTLCKAAAILKRPVITTEQYPKAFGHTVPELQSLLVPAVRPLGRPLVYTKMSFSMLTGKDCPVADEFHTQSEAEFLEDAAEARPTKRLQHVVLFGIEAHVCLQQTALELISRGVQVTVPVEGVSSQRAGDRKVALALLAARGVSVTTTESLLLTLCETAQHPNFKELSKLLIAHNARPTHAEMY